MRVLHLWDNYAPHLFDQSFEICAEEGIDAGLVCLNLIDRGVVAADISFVRRVRGDDRSGAGGRIARKLRRWIDERRFRHLVKQEVRNFRPDLLHIHYGTTGAILASSAVLQHVPFVMSFYGFDISQAPRSAKIRSSYRKVFRLRPLVHVLCDEAADRAIALGAEPADIVDANLPLPIDRYPAIGVDGPVRHWLLPARFVEKKGHRVLLDAFKLHLREQPDARLTCWGYGESEWLEDVVFSLGLSEQVAVINNGGSPDFDALYLEQLRGHDAVITPSVRSSRGDDEGGPALTTVLAQVAAKPVIVSDFPGSERSVTDGVEGLVVAQRDSAALAEAMNKLAVNGALAVRMGKAGRKRAVREFARGAYRHALVGWYHRLTR